MPVSNINHVVITGGLTSDPDLRVLPSGNSVCHIRIAVNARRRDAAGVWGDKPNYFDVMVFGPRGENVAKHMHKGRPIAIDGRLDWREWEASDGRRTQTVSIIAHKVQFLGSPPSSDMNGFGDDGLAGSLDGIAGGEEESLDIEDQEAIALAGS